MANGKKAKLASKPIWLNEEAMKILESWRHTGQTPSGAIIDKELELQKLKEARQ